LRTTGVEHQAPFDAVDRHGNQGPAVEALHRDSPPFRCLRAKPKHSAPKIEEVIELPEHILTDRAVDPVGKRIEEHFDGRHTGLADRDLGLTRGGEHRSSRGDHLDLPAGREAEAFPDVRVHHARLGARVHQEPEGAPAVHPHAFDDRENRAKHQHQYLHMEENRGARG
jgi:hypothetical protein